eukprot:TRINITY_DN14324_c1_g3_i1.p1 TRINITY_DN14324_c1_g3~~TRINITY_DN14324_c1_g3_i1.p1  ORF type:complete len:727 (+),score=184.72 TRINITY_DN14324_c1_g3_i1:31-2181(+)
MDPRFDTSRDPRFKRAPRSVRRVQVDERFKRIFSDSGFAETSAVDSRGQKLRRSAGKAKLHDFYELADVDIGGGSRSSRKPSLVESEQAQGDTKRKTTRAGWSKSGQTIEQMMASEEGQADQEVNEEEDEEILEENAEEKEDDEEDEEEEEEDDDDEDEDDENANEKSAAWQVAQDAIPKGDATRRLAIMGCDWDRISAGDLLVMFHTYLDLKKSKRGSGSIEKVSIYPSDYGIKQMEKEAKEGPQLFDANVADDMDEKQAEIAQQEALRLYQIERTKYYWALVECDSQETGSWLYDQMDGLEADGICPGMLDLRFVPDDVIPPHKASSEATDIPSKFSAPNIHRSATSHTKVKCTWDETPAKRRKDLMRKNFSANELADMDLKAYLASSSGEEEDEVNDKTSGARELRALVGGSDSEAIADESSSEIENMGSGGPFGSSKTTKRKSGGEEMGDMEATFNLKASRLEEELAERAKDIGKGVQHLESKQPKGTWETYLEKRKEKRKEKKLKAKQARDEVRGTQVEEHTSKNKSRKQPWNFAENTERGLGELELLATDANMKEDRGFNLRGPQRRAHDVGQKAKNAEDDQISGFRVDVNDPRISKVFSDADFAIDPTNPEFRKSDGMQEVLREKRERKPKSALNKVEPLNAGKQDHLRRSSLSKAEVESKPPLVEKAGIRGSLQIFASDRSASVVALDTGAPKAKSSNTKKKKAKRKQ